MPMMTKRELHKLCARKHFPAFITFLDRSFNLGWVHAEIAEALERFLEAVVKRQSPRLMITMPPRHGKSQVVSRLFPAYAFGRYPDLSIIATSYAADLASRNNRDVQRIIDEPKYHEVFPDTALYGKNVRSVMNGSYMRNSDIFEIVGHKGSYRSAGVGGGITGMGGDILIIDDPFKDRAEADSVTIRNAVWDWYTSTLYTRKAPGGGIIVINTRWHCDDLSGRLLDAEKRGDGDSWECINFPAIAEHDEKYRKAGEALHPERYALSDLLQIQKAIGSRDWNALYQQHPVPDGGALFDAKWLKHWSAATLPTQFDQLIQSWDMAFKGTDSSDFVVGQVWGKKGANLYLIDQVRGRWDFVHTLSMVQILTQKHPKAWTKLVEEKANGAAVMSSLHGTVGGFVPIVPKESKEARAFAITPLFESGNVYLPPLETDWVNRDLLPELLQFPSGAHDDQVDALTQALSYLHNWGDAIWEQIARL
jgi:predicted phage terminase large subunit-like protein